MHQRHIGHRAHHNAFIVNGHGLCVHPGSRMNKVSRLAHNPSFNLCGIGHANQFKVRLLVNTQDDRSTFRHVGESTQRFWQVYRQSPSCLFHFNSSVIATVATQVLNDLEHLFLGPTHTVRLQIYTLHCKLFYTVECKNPPNSTFTLQQCKSHCKFLHSTL